jgi:ABC-type glycerol-3-phosphate transport system substrate-binding protein
VLRLRPKRFQPAHTLRCAFTSIMKRMKKQVLLLALVAALVGGWNSAGFQVPFVGVRAPVDTDQPTGAGSRTAAHDALADAFSAQRSGVQVSGEGVVSAMLPDDEKGSRHQRFVLRVASGQTVLVAHNIDLAPRIDGLAKGDTVGFNGVFEWNVKGGVIHWTHHDPAGRHIPGWLRHRGKTYE